MPENPLKFAVGLMLASFGMFWSAEGVGVEWPGTDLATWAVLGLRPLAIRSALVALLRRQHELTTDAAQQRQEWGTER